MQNEEKEPEIGLLEVSGPDSKKFLQGQLTCNLEELAEGQSLLGAHCNPKGRVISFFRIYFIENNYYLQMPVESLEIAKKALEKYSVFFKVKIVPNLNLEKINNHFEPFPNIHASIPGIYPETSEKFLPHDLNLPELGAISFNKGCYTGQEIIARMHYKGKPKYHLRLARIETQKPLKKGMDIYDEHHSCGYVVDYQPMGYNTFTVLITVLKDVKKVYIDKGHQEPLQLIE